MASKEDDEILELQRRIAAKEEELKRHIKEKEKEDDGHKRKKKVRPHTASKAKDGARPRTAKVKTAKSAKSAPTGKKTKKKTAKSRKQREADDEEDRERRRLEEKRAELGKVAADIIDTEGEDEITWRKIKLLGAGSFGKVYLAKDNMDRSIAVKVIEIAMEWEGAERMLKTVRVEIVALKQLQHRNIVTYFGCGKLATVDATLLSLSVYMEYVAGGSLMGLITRYKRVSEDNSKLKLCQVVDGLVYLHSKGIVHRDLKPDNLLLDKTPCGACPFTVKIADFGASKELDEMQCTANGATLTGTPHYMAPEVMQRVATQKADVWSIGATLYHMLHGSPPWSDVTPMQMLFFHTSAQMPEWPERISDECKDFLTGCFTFNHSDRPTAAQLFDHAWLPPAPP